MTLDQTYLSGLKNYSNSNNLTYRNKITDELLTAAEYGNRFGKVEPYLYHDCMVKGLKMLEGDPNFEICITPRDITNLKKEWLADPIWDIEDTEGFESVREELIAFAEEQKLIWQRDHEEQVAQRKAKEIATRIEQDNDARKFGLEGMYQLLIKQQQEITDLQNILNALIKCDDTASALQIMQCAINGNRWPIESDGVFK